MSRPTAASVAIPPDTPRNKAAQAQATLLVKLPIKEGVLGVNELLSSQHNAEDVATQYYTQLLEGVIGVRLQGAALHHAKAVLRLTASSVKAHTRVTGAALQVAGAAPLPTPTAGLPAQQLQLFNTLQPILQQQRQQRLVGSGCSSSNPGFEVALHQLEHQLEHGPSFMEYVQQLTYPYCTRRTLNHLAPIQQQEAAAVARSIVGKHCAIDIVSSCSKVGPSKGSSLPACNLRKGPMAAQQDSKTAGTADIAELTPEVLQELSQEFHITPRLVLHLQQSLADKMSAELLRNHRPDLARWGVHAQDVAAMAQLLQAQPVLKLALTLLYHLYTRHIVDSTDLPQHLSQHLQSQLRATSKAKGLAAKRRSAVLPMGNAGSTGSLVVPAGTAAAVSYDPELDSTDKWDLGCALLLARKAEAAANAVCKAAETAAETALEVQHRLLVLPPGCGQPSQRAYAWGSQSSGPADSDNSPSGSRGNSRRGSMAGSLQRQESNCSSTVKSRASYADSIASARQHVESNRRAAQLLAAADVGELQSCRMGSMLQAWEQIKHQLSRSEHGSTFAIPVLLLSLRVLAQQVFSSMYPLWKRSIQGAATIQAITDAPAQLLDPQRCFESITILAGSPAAVITRQRHDSGPITAAERRHRRVGLSGVVAAALGQPASPALRKLLGTSATLQHHLSCAAQPSPVQGSQMVTLGCEVVHSAASHKMTQLICRKEG